MENEVQKTPASFGRQSERESTRTVGVSPGSSAGRYFVPLTSFFSVNMYMRNIDYIPRPANHCCLFSRRLSYVFILLAKSEANS